MLDESGTLAYREIAVRRARLDQATGGSTPLPSREVFPEMDVGTISIEQSSECLFILI
jgi:hypothetical protein